MLPYLAFDGREQFATRHPIEVAFPSCNADEEPGVRAAGQEACHLGNVEELVPDVPCLELGDGLDAPARPVDDKVDLARRPIPVRRAVVSSSATRLGARPPRRSDARRAGPSSFTSWTPFRSSRPDDRASVRPVSPIADCSDTAGQLSPMARIQAHTSATRTHLCPTAHARRRTREPHPVTWW